MTFQVVGTESIAAICTVHVLMDIASMSTRALPCRQTIQALHLKLVCEFAAAWGPVISVHSRQPTTTHGPSRQSKQPSRSGRLAGGPYSRLHAQWIATSFCLFGFFSSFLSSTVSDHRQELPRLSTGCPTSCSAVDASARIEVLSRLAFVPLFFPLRIPSLSYLPIVRSRPLRPSPTS